jgi:hypothetical protein
MDVKHLGSLLMKWQGLALNRVPLAVAQQLNSEFVHTATRPYTRKVPRSALLANSKPKRRDVWHWRLNV